MASHVLIFFFGGHLQFFLYFILIAIIVNELGGKSNVSHIWGLQRSRFAGGSSKQEILEKGFVKQQICKNRSAKQKFWETLAYSIETYSVPYTAI